jgi:hypothetical protein
MAALISVHMKLDAVTRLLMDRAKAETAERELVQAGVEILTPLARQEAPVKTGAGAGQIHGFIDSRGVGHIRPSGKAFYLAILAVGAKPHEIYPRTEGLARGRDPFVGRLVGPGYTPRLRKKTLRFAVGGQMFFRRRVRHRGLRPNPFLDRAAIAGDMPVAQAAHKILEIAYGRGA